MFSKLLKHEWRANWNLLSLLTLAAIGVAVLGTIALRVLVNYSEQIAQSESFLQLLLLPLGLLVFVSFLVLALYAAAVNIVLLFRFYKNKFTDEGYLTFTLPVKTSQIFLSSAVHMLIWMVISLVLVFVLFAMMILFGTATSGLVNMELIDIFKDMKYVMEGLAQIFRELLGDSMGVLTLLQMLISPVYSVVLSMTCVTLGAVLAKKHKILAAIGISYAASMALGIVSSIVTSIPSLLIIGNPSQNAASMLFTVMAVLQLLIYVAVAIGGYFLSTHLMKNKLNLP